MVLFNIHKMQDSFTISTDRNTGLYDITGQVKRIVGLSGVKTGIVNVYVQGATAAIMIQENWDESVQNDVVSLLRKIVPPGIWEHDHQDNNGDAHLKSGLIGPSETIPIIEGEIGLSRWQNIFLCEFDGPRETRRVVITVYEC
jgi:secondary thiamine-phosphate synthase enzyme